MFKAIDKWIAKRIYPTLVRLSAKKYEKQFKNRRQLAMRVYMDNIKRFRKYNITVNDIEKVIK